jgi:hypothetical protein
MSKILVKIFISLIAATALLLVFFLLDNRGSKADGEFDFILYNEFDEVVIDDRLEFKEGQVLFDVLEKEYAIVCAGPLYQKDESCSYEFVNGHVILEIEAVKTNWYDSFLEVYINGVHSNYGVSLIELHDNDLIEIKWTDVNE